MYKLILTGTQVLCMFPFLICSLHPRRPRPPYALRDPHLILVGGTVATKRAAAKPEHQNDHLGSCPSAHIFCPMKTKDPIKS